MDKELQEAIQIVTDLNDQLFNNLGEFADYPEFHIITNGLNFKIIFQETCLYSSVDDIRDFNEETNDFESLYEFLLKQMKDSIKELNAVLSQFVKEEESNEN